MRLLLTRPVQEAQASAARLRQLGHKAVVCPVTAIVVLEPALPNRTIDGILATSAKAFCAAVAKAALTRWPEAPGFFVGSKTHHSARTAGFAVGRPAHVAIDAATLVHNLRLPAPASFVYLAGRDRKPDLEGALQAEGHRVAVVETYFAQAVAALDTESLAALQAGAIDGVLHYSRRSAEIFLRLARQERLDRTVRAMRHFCLSVDVAGVLRDFGAKRVEISATPDEDGLLALVPPD